ncbi:MAG: ATP-binding protein [Melioribacteraceae bacterium]|nr:ATP-binding protein [Melioribacteraceae bacterium]
MKSEIDITKTEIVISSSTDNLSLLRSFIEFHGREFKLNKREIAHISLSVDEACTNIIEHAYKNSKNGKIKIKIDKNNNKIFVKLTDNGSKFDPSIIPEPNIAENQKLKKGGGLGMFLMKKIMDEVKYNAKGKSNELILIKYLT